MVIPEWFLSLGYVEIGLIIAAAGGAVWCWLCGCSKRAERKREQEAAQAWLERLCKDE